MAQYIDKDALVIKIDNLKHKVGDDYTYGHGWNDALRMVEAELDTLEVKEMDLEKEYVKKDPVYNKEEIQWLLNMGLFSK